MRLPEEGHVVQISIKCGKPKSHHTVAKCVLRLTSLPCSALTGDGELNA